MNYANVLRVVLTLLLLVISNSASAQTANVSAKQKVLLAELQRSLEIGDLERIIQIKRLNFDLLKFPSALECFAFGDQNSRNPKLSLGEFFEATKLDPQNIRLQISLAQGLNDVGSQREAYFRIEKVVKAEPKNARAHAIKALILQQLGKSKESESALQTAEKLGLSPSVWEAKYFHAMNELNQAKTLKIVDAYLKANPEKTGVLVFHGRAMRNAGRLVEAQQDFERVLQKETNHLSALTQLADVLRLESKYQQAVLVAKKRLKLARTPEERILANRSIAESEEKANNLSAAAVARENMIKEVVQRKRCLTESELKNILMSSRNLIKLKRWKLAADRLTLALTFDPMSSEALEKRAICYAQLNQNAEAVKDYTRLISIHSDIPSWYRQRGELFRKLGKGDEAAKDLKRVRDLEEAQKRDENL